MRIWDVSPAYLNRYSLLGEHRELHGLASILTHGKNGYSRHPETVRWMQRLAIASNDPYLLASTALSDLAPFVLYCGDATNRHGAAGGGLHRRGARAG